jgi:hypothetical protein
LRFNDIRRSAPCRILEEKLDLPALLIDLRDGQCGQGEVVGQKHQSLAGDGIEVAHTAQSIWIRRRRSDGCQDDGLVRVHSGAFVHRMRVAAFEQYVLFGGAQAGFDVTEALAIGQLSKGYRQIRVAAGEAPMVRISAIALDTLLELVGG